MNNDVDSEDAVRRAPPWTEAVGTVEGVGAESIALTFKATRTFHVASDQIAKWRGMLRKGSRVGILFLDDGSIRVRGLDVTEDAKPRNRRC